MTRKICKRIFLFKNLSLFQVFNLNFYESNVFVQNYFYQKHDNIFESNQILYYPQSKKNKYQHITIFGS